jgi:GntR family transcriptional regulator
MLEYSGSTPLYIQIKDLLLSDILSGRLQPGQKIPTEFELSSTYGVSRITVRGAVLELVKSGHLVRRQGKGTFVYKPTPDENVPVNQSFTTVCRESGVVPGSEVIVNTLRPAGQYDISELELPEGSNVLYIERIRFANGSPVILEYNFFPEKFSALAHSLSDDVSIYSLLENEYSIGRLKSVKRISIAKTDEYQSALLGKKNGTYVLYVREIVYNAQHVPVHLTTQYVLSDRFEYIVN